ncbi:hypothetical protein BCR42DRAFT_473663 [Absidia repens]|uniref:Uncharacterized protein n=1 Tax=Absidia repens TaxID=90262 RepID=A0A1X2HZU6_9FUNG|nr:hypothetical protein BCR42DRAFT_473663 [Absidia repens]
MVFLFFYLLFLNNLYQTKQNNTSTMVQASSFLLLLAFSAVMIQGAPLAARSKEHHTKDKPPTEESKLQLPDEAGDPPMFDSRASVFGPTLNEPFAEQGTPLGTGGTRSVQARPLAAPASCVDPQNPQAAAQRGPMAVQEGPVQGPVDAEPVPEPTPEPPIGPDSF